MTKTEAIEYAVYRYKNREAGEATLDVLLEKDGEYKAGTWAEFDYAKTCGWTYAGSTADEARAMGLI